MKIIAPMTTNTTTYTAGFRNLTPLYTTHILEANDTVFLNPLEPEQRLFALTDIPTYIQEVPIPTPGVLRIYSNEIRWGGSYRISQTDPTIVIPLNKNTHTTIVLDYEGDGTPAIVYKQETCTMIRGVFRTEHCTIIANRVYSQEWERAQRNNTPLRNTATEYAKALGIVTGVDYITSGVSPETKKMIEKNLEQHTVEFDEKWMKKLTNYYSAVYSEASKIFVKELGEQVGGLYSWDGSEKFTEV